LEQDINWLKTLLFGSKEECLLSDDVLISIAISYPAVLVAIADNYIDKEEKLFIASISKSLMDRKIDNDEGQLSYLEIYASFAKLLQINETDSETLINIIAKHCAIDNELGNLIVNAMYGVAEASNGVSAEESVVIEGLKKKLGIKVN
jgi:tellurite resistance protein